MKKDSFLNDLLFRHLLKDLLHRVCMQQMLRDAHKEAISSTDESILRSGLKKQSKRPAAVVMNVDITHLETQLAKCPGAVADDECV